MYLRQYIKFFNDMSLEYTSEVFRPSYRRHNTRVSTLTLDVPFWKYCSGQKTLSYLGPRKWNTLPAQIKFRRSVNTFKHDIKKLLFDKLQKDTDDVFVYYLPKQPPIYLHFHILYYPWCICIPLFIVFFKGP